MSSTSLQQALEGQIQETWNNSTHPFSALLGIWLIIYSLYLLILAAVVYGFSLWQ
ncbi:hypothetical protein [Nostoc sp.]|uniref:hypothetical protein n=1 Tax=Nostoc sp. TaxID=1180 RepID=UPI0035947A7D